MIRIGICDDDSRARDALRWKLERLLEEEQEQIIYDFSSGTGVVQWLQKHPGQMDLLFLDVEMEPCTGLEAARQIRQFNESLLIVFVTGFADFVFEGYQVRALDYLLKPVEETRLEAVLSSARKALAQSEEDYLCIRTTRRESTASGGMRSSTVTATGERYRWFCRAGKSNFTTNWTPSHSG